MPYTLKWDDEQHTIYHLHLFGEWTWEDWTIAFRQAHAEIGTESHRVDFIIQIQNRIPKGNAAPHFKYAGREQPPNARHSVLVNQSGIFLELLLKGIIKQHGWDGPKFTETVEEGGEYLLEKRLNMDETPE